MNRRFFRQIPEFVKFRVVFEDNETVPGASGSDERRLFRKDSGKVSFNEREPIEAFVAAFLEKEFSDESEVVCV
jgi:hypothetical protein